jgi:hypothetical protein
MGFADFYFERFKIYNNYFPEDPVSHDLKLIVIIPSYREFRLYDTLECLSRNNPSFQTEVIVMFNAPQGEDRHVLEMHRHQAKNISRFDREKIKFLPVIEENVSERLAGAGMARKLAMDIALSRFNRINYPDGIIVSLDADTLCEPNYLQAIYEEFKRRPKASGASIAYEHPIQGDEFPQEVYDAIILYELYLRYYIQALRYIHFPYAFHTIGSAMAVRAWAYAKAGGMGVQKAGEDFYFLHKVMQLGGFFEIKSTKVYPSPRISNRVVFGTGPAIRQIISKREYDYPTYPLESFLQLKPIFVCVEDLYTEDWQDLPLSEELQEFLKANFFAQALEKMRKNSSKPETFAKRFWQWFDAFRILKFLNFLLQEKGYEKAPVTQESRKLLKLIGKRAAFTAKDLLLAYRELQN